jgi:hypothetical protein
MRDYSLTNGTTSRLHQLHPQPPLSIRGCNAANALLVSMLQCLPFLMVRHQKVLRGRVLSAKPDYLTGKRRNFYLL